MSLIKVTGCLLRRQNTASYAGFRHGSISDPVSTLLEVLYMHQRRIMRMVKQTVTGVTVTKPEADMPKASKLKQYFPLVREREELLREIKGNPKLR